MSKYFYLKILKSTGCSIRLTVCHEPQPKGLRSVIIQRQLHEPLGLSICGGIGGTPVNPEDSTDEGIFIERVENMGPAAVSNVGLCVGLRILEVNRKFYFYILYSDLLKFPFIFRSLKIPFSLLFYILNES